MSLFYSAGLGNAIPDTAIPDSEANQKLEHRYILDTLGDGTAEDSVGSADGSNNGVASVDGDWLGGSAGDGDGSSSYINVGSLGDYGSQIPDGAIAFSIKYTSGQDSHVLGGIQNQNLQVAIGHDSASTGQVYFDLKDNSGRRSQIHSSETVDGGSEYRVVINIPSGDASTHEIWFNQTQQTANVVENITIDMSDFSEDIYLFARNGGPNSTDHIIDDICLFDQSLSQSEIQSYNNPWQ